MREKKRFLHIGLQQCVHSFFSIRDNPFSPFNPCSISTKQLDTNMILPLVPAAHRLASKRCYPFFSFLCAAATLRESTIHFIFYLIG